MNYSICSNIGIKIRATFILIYCLVFLTVTDDAFTQPIISLQLIPLHEIDDEYILVLQDSLENYFNVKTKLGDKGNYHAFEKLLLNDVIEAKPFLDSLEINIEIGDLEKIIFITNKKIAPVRVPTTI